MTLRRADQSVEVGRFAVFPSEPFTAKTTAEERGYNFNIGEALTRLKTAEGPLAVHVQLLPIAANASTEEAQLTIASAELAILPQDR